MGSWSLPNHKDVHNEAIVNLEENFTIVAANLRSWRQVPASDTLNVAKKLHGKEMDIVVNLEKQQKR